MLSWCHFQVGQKDLEGSCPSFGASRGSTGGSAKDPLKNPLRNPLKGFVRFDGEPT